ncbi:RING/U-box superfamily protein [Hibiscus syriacus]|uniref:RING/U-box superfamily protein n=1 Tax=Hibiscus syriacus TaxID=106335 RepID=A0A6A3A1H6_HIBSY|nr:RING/U-box superfamily protein [Hibiscus syriacus]
MESDSISNLLLVQPLTAKISPGRRESAKLKQCKLDARREQWLSQTTGAAACRGEWILGQASPIAAAVAARVGGCCSGNVTEEEEGDDGCLDDWEAVADALAADDDKQEMDPNENNKENPCLGTTPGHEPNPQFGSKGEGPDLRGSKPECPRMVQRAEGTRAWKADDTYRPHTLPNLTKQRRFGSNGLKFSPCSCGFRLCLFCHKRILEEDGRCPGCRKPYERDPVEAVASVQGGSLTFRMLARSCSMVARS